jgi:glycosyltransferase 2 family protein
VNRKTARILVRVGAGVLLLVALGIAASRLLKMEDTLRALFSLHPGYLAPILALALLYYVLKALRWHYYLRVAGIRVPVVRSMAAYLAGQWFTFTPAGELMRAYLLGAGSSFMLVAPTVVMQVVVDFASLALIATLAVPIYPALAPVVLPVTIPLLATLLMVALPPLRRFASTWSVLHRFASGKGKLVSGQLAVLVAPWPVIAGLLIGVPTVLSGAFALYISGLALGVEQWPVTGVVAVYAMTQLLGGISPLPQGLGVAEGSGTILLGYLGVDPGAALAAMLLSRAAVLGFSVLLGLLAFLTLRLTVPELSHVPMRGLGDAARERAAAEASGAA